MHLFAVSIKWLISNVVLLAAKFLIKRRAIMSIAIFKPVCSVSLVALKGVVSVMITRFDSSAIAVSYLITFSV